MNIACATKEKRNVLVLSMGAALEATKHGKMISHLIAFVDIDVHLSKKLYFQYLCFIK